MCKPRWFTLHRLNEGRRQHACLKVVFIWNTDFFGGFTFSSKLGSCQRSSWSDRVRCVEITSTMIIVTIMIVMSPWPWCSQWSSYHMYLFFSLFFIVPGGIDANSTMISSVEFWDAATGRWAIWEELYFDRFSCFGELEEYCFQNDSPLKEKKRLKGTIRRIVIIVWPMSLWAFMIIFWETGNSHYIPPHHCDHCDHQVGDDAKTSERKKRSQDGRDERKVDGW